MMGLVELGKEILGPQPGATLLLFVIAGISMWSYWREKKRNETLMEERLEETRADTELYASTLNEAVSAVKEFKAANEALKIAFEALANSISKVKR
jgi:hypothetical protein